MGPTKFIPVQNKHTHTQNNEQKDLYLLFFGRFVSLTTVFRATYHNRA